MSKMRMPEMSVVRFTESDVIVASSYRLENWTNGEALDGKIYNMNGGVVYNHVQGPGGVTTFADMYGNPDFHPTDGSPYAFNLNYLVNSDNPDTPVTSDTDGTYKWKDGAFYRVQ